MPGVSFARDSVVARKVRILEGEHGNIQSSFDYFLRFKLEKNARILDVGCGFGTLISNLYEEGYTDVLGIDTDANRIAKGRKEHHQIANRLVVYEGQHLPYDDDRFDIVLMFDVIEHIPNAGVFLQREVRRIMKNSGCLMFQTPNRIINIGWSVLQHKSLTKYKDYHPSLHGYTSLRRMLEDIGFRNVRIEKQSVVTDHNMRKVGEKLGKLGHPVLILADHLPLVFFPNLWGSCIK